MKEKKCYVPVICEDCGGGRIMLDSDLDLYVRKDGSDDNDGFTDSPEGAFLTIQAAIDSLMRFDAQGYDISIIVHEGKYLERLSMAHQLMSVGFYMLTLTGFGDEAVEVMNGESTSYLINCAGSYQVTIQKLIVSANPQYTVSNLIGAENGVAAKFGNLTLQSTSPTALTSVAVRSAFASLDIIDDIVIKISKCVYVFTATLNSHIFIRKNIHHALSMSMTYYAFANSGGYIRHFDGGTFTGELVSGTKFRASLNGAISSSEQGANLFPGTINGTTASGGVYD